MLPLSASHFAQPLPDNVSVRSYALKRSDNFFKKHKLADVGMAFSLLRFYKYQQKRNVWPLYHTNIRKTTAVYPNKVSEQTSFLVQFGGRLLYVSRDSCHWRTPGPANQVRL